MPRFEDTYNDLQDCYDNWNETSSRFELECRKDLFELCKKIVSECEIDN